MQIQIQGVHNHIQLRLGFHLLQHLGIKVTCMKDLHRLLLILRQPNLLYILHTATTMMALDVSHSSEPGMFFCIFLLWI